MMMDDRRRCVMAGEKLTVEERERLEEFIGCPIGPLTEDELEEKKMDVINQEIVIVREERRRKRLKRIEEVGLEALEAEEAAEQRAWKERIAKIKGGGSGI
jgi:hypothetical protein